MAANYELTVPVEEMAVSAQAFQTDSSQMDTVINTLRSHFNRLTSSWEGTAMQSFQTKFNKLCNDLEHAKKPMDDAARDLAQARETYLASENTIGQTDVAALSDVSPYVG